MKRRRHVTGNYAPSARPVGRKGDPEPRGFTAAGIWYDFPRPLQPPRPSVAPPLWARGTDPIPQETEPVNDTQTTLGLLAELETVLAEAEELRYRILCAVRNNARPASPQKQPVATQPKPTPAPALEPKPVPQLDTSALVRSGRGLYAWAKDNHHADQLIALGKAAAFPAHIIDWSREQVEEAIEALAILITQPSPARNTAATPATSSAPKPTRGRRGQRNLYPSDR